ncbi:uncharacterized protein LOC132300063 [Cornus florida]|uniref:uncharacterized protein LOC132300063 n=1 Tax=Cornus florida TaxID=4283 RepID=UPI00289B6021|nr:uncharacterized protein LOC132300063 [Cornus florida]
MESLIYQNCTANTVPVVLFEHMFCYLIWEPNRHLIRQNRPTIIAFISIFVHSQIVICTTQKLGSTISLKDVLTVNIGNELTMHKLLRDMGREIVHQESPKKPGERSRLWDHKDALHVLREKTGTESIEGLILNLPGNNSLKRRSSGLGFFSWLHVTSASTKSFSTSNEVNFQTDAFSRMHNLRLLQLNSVRPTGN